MCRRLIDRANYLEKVMEMLDYFSSQISYTRMPVAEIIASLADSERFDSLRFLKQVRDDLRAGVPFPEAWRTAVTQGKNAILLGDEDMNRLFALGEYIGTTDSEEQGKTIALYQKMFTQSHEKARSESTAHAKMYTTLGVLAGIGLAVLII